MNRRQISVRFRVVIGVASVMLAGAMLVSRSIKAADNPPATNAAPFAQPAQGAQTEAGGALFSAFVPVLRHPRCMNCHSSGDFPRQGDDGHQHIMNVRRGAGGNGVTAEKCVTCHQDHNLAGEHLPPGAPNWGLPPRATPMIWQGLTDAQLCRSIKDPKQNKNRNLDQLVEHLTEDKLVAWGWNPGEGRAAIPMPREEFAARVKKWQAAGAPCPADGAPAKITKLE
jgi:hypothetical protein